MTKMEENLIAYALNQLVEGRRPNGLLATPSREALDDVQEALTFLYQLEELKRDSTYVARPLDPITVPRSYRTH